MTTLQLGTAQLAGRAWEPYVQICMSLIGSVAQSERLPTEAAARRSGPSPTRSPHVPSISRSTWNFEVCRSDCLASAACVAQVLLNWRQTSAEFWCVIRSLRRRVPICAGKYVTNPRTPAEIAAGSGSGGLQGIVRSHGNAQGSLGALVGLWSCIGLVIRSGRLLYSARVAGSRPAIYQACELPLELIGATTLARAPAVSDAALRISGIPSPLSLGSPPPPKLHVDNHA